MKSDVFSNLAMVFDIAMVKREGKHEIKGK